MESVKNYVVPSIFGALIISFAMKFPKIIPFAVLVPLACRLWTPFIPGYWYVLITIIATVAATLVIYKKEIYAKD